MLSIIISTYKPKNFNVIEQNIFNTIGATEYEIIKINNHREMSLSKAYNKGAALAKFENLLFLHDDIEILSNNWGITLLKTLDIESVGVTGLAGGTKKFQFPTGHDLGIEEYRFISVVHRKDEVLKKKIANPIKVKTLDGVFLALKKRRWQELKFNEEISDFHFYDLDLSLRASEKYQNYIIPQLVIRHLSEGKFGNEWIKASIKFHKGDYSFDLYNRKESNIVRKFWYRRLRKEDISSRNRLLFILHMGISKSCSKEALKFLTFNYNKRS